MYLLTDISIPHTYTGKKASEPINFTMHPFQNGQGEYAGRYEIIRNIEEATKRMKRSAHVTHRELAELYARGLIEQYKIRLRLRPSNGDYPDSPPGKFVTSQCIERDSEFDRAVREIDIKKPITDGLRMQLQRIGLV